MAERDAKKVAASLTPFQRRAILESAPTDIQSFGRARNALIRQRIAEYREIGRSKSAFALTDFGLAVRSHIIGEDK